MCNGCDYPESPPKPLERLFAGLLLASLLHVWVFGVIVIPVALVLALGYHDYRLLSGLVVYYSYRILVPAKESAFVRRIYRTGAKYFDYQRIVMDGFSQIPSSSKSMICYHPHGILTIGWALSTWIPLYQIKWLVAEALMRLPFVSDFLSWNGCAPVSKEYMSARMAKGTNLALLPGGFEEATLYRRGQYEVYLKNRTGFIVYCLRYGYKIYPAFCFGEELCYHAMTNFPKFRLWLNSFRAPAVVFLGAFGVMPGWWQQLVTVIGQPLQLPKIEQPTTKEIDEWHGKYIKALHALFDKHKEKYADSEAQLAIF